MPTCELCATPGGRLLWQSPACRVVRVDNPEYPGFCRVIWKAHVREMTDLAAEERHDLMAVVFATEHVVRRLFSPDKINLASLGNVTPHLHWHVIPRWVDDPHFPDPIWGRLQRSDAVRRPVLDDQQISDALTLELQDIQTHK